MQYISLVNFTVVPVELTSFTSTVSGNKVVLNWVTSTEKNNSGFDIERSADNISFTKVGFIPGYGTTTETKSYSFTDQQISAGKYYYRLKQIDYDGTFEYSNTIKAEIGLPLEFALEQNYPNPFNPTTTIRYTVADAYYASGVPVRLVVFDVLGNEVVTLVNENQPAGHYEIQFNAEGLSSGIYYYKLISGSFSETKKLILLK
ncbi:MAG: T9SS type A sorting domain-containing protein [Ignavibacteriales bacterium]|nr:MAG: T9SS type A sorting domain-containing protein [Ignavibacteriales bacterium]